MTINADRKIISLTGPNCSFANINACRVDVVAASGASGGTAALGWSTPSLSVGSTLTITTDGTYSFGAHSLDVAHSTIDLASIDVNADVPSTAIYGWSSVTSGARLSTQIKSDAIRGRVIYGQNDGDNNGPANSTLLFDFGSAIEPSKKIFVSYWYKISPYDADGNGQWKMFRVSSTNDIIDHDGEVYVTRWDGPGVSSSFTMEHHLTTDVSYFGSGTDGDRFPQFEDDAWRRIDAVWNLGDYATANGSNSLQGMSSNNSMIELSLAEYSPVVGPYPTNALFYDSSADRFRYFIFQNFFGNGVAPGALKDYGAEVWMSDVYVQVGNWARIELANTAVLANATKRTIQKPSAWTGTSISVLLTYSGFNSGDTAYIHVVTDDNLPMQATSTISLTVP